MTSVWTSSINLCQSMDMSIPITLTSLRPLNYKWDAWCKTNQSQKCYSSMLTQFLTDKSESVYSYCCGIFHFPTPNARDYTVTKSLPHEVACLWDCCCYGVFQLQDVFGDKPLRTKTEQLYFSFLIEIQFY